MFIEIVKNNTGLIEIDSYVECSEISLIYSTTRFLDLIESHLDADGYWLVARDHENIVGVLPFIVKKTKLGIVYNSLAYYGSNGGVVQTNSDENIKKKLIERFYVEASRSGALSATIISNPLDEQEVYEKYTGYELKDQRIGQITPLPNISDSKELMDLFDPPRPRNIRKAIKEGVVIRESKNKEDVKFLYETHKKNMESIGGLAKKESFFNLLVEKMGEDEWSIYVAEINGIKVAALLLLYNRKAAEYFTPVILEDFRNTQALSLVIFEAMKHSIEEGRKYWNWGGTWLSQGGVYDFKKKWGTKDYPYFYYTRVFDSNLKGYTKEVLLENFEGFYVLPFRELD